MRKNIHNSVFRFVSLVCLSLSFFACGSGEAKKAGALLDEARLAYSQGRMNEALILIDSIAAAYPREVEVRRSGMAFEDSVRLAVNENIFRTTDSLIAEASAKIDSVASVWFIYEKTEYDELGRFIAKSMDAARSSFRTYIHAAVNEYGCTQLMSSYCGSSELNHTALKLSLSSGESVTTSEIPYNDGANYHYKVNETCCEVVTYTDAKDGGALAFAALHNGETVKATLLGGKKEIPVTVSSQDLQALAATFELSVLLKDRLRLTQERKTAQLMVEKLQKKLQKRK